MALQLRVHIVEKDVTKTIQFDPTMMVYDACRYIRDKVVEATNLTGEVKDYGLFLVDEDPKKGVWLEPGRSLGYYILKSGDLIQYRRKMRTIKVRMLDGTVKTLLVDDSQPVANLMVVICTKIGITNHDEYSLLRDKDEDEDQENRLGFGTLTLRRKRDDKDRERDAKMEQLKKKLKTDDDLNWVDHSKTLREQGIDETETVLLRRKYFFSDQNIDQRDPVQLNLLYVQCRDAIIEGAHPVTIEKACEFAGLQCQIQFGNHMENKHKPGFLDLKEYLPQSFIKSKNVEKKIYTEHKKLSSVSEIEAKARYTQLARSLKTYGVTFFLVKEKMKGKNKLVPRLLGVTKDSVLRLDEKTKEIMKTWPLTTVRRWVASPNTFTLDFGDYSDNYYSVQTTEGEQIAQLISGYIDIILKKKQVKDYFGIEGDESSTMVEDNVSPLRATVMQHHQTKEANKVSTESVAKPAVLRGSNGAQPYGTGHMQMTQYSTIQGQASLGHSPSTQVQQPRVTSVLSEPQKALVTTIYSGQQAISAAHNALNAKIDLPQLGTDPASLKWKQMSLDTSKQNVSSQIAAMNAATAQVVTLTGAPQEEVDHTAVGAAINTITTNLPGMARDVKMIAALIDDEQKGETVVDATRKLCTAFSDLLTAAEPENKEPRQNLLNAASKVGEASHRVLTTIEEEDVIDREVQDILLALAKAVANATAALVLKAKNVAARTEDSELQNRVIGAATQCALATSQLVACAKVVAPTIHNPSCQDQLIEATKGSHRAVEGIVSVCQEACPEEQVMSELGRAAGDVTKALDDLLHHIRIGIHERKMESTHERTVDTILTASDRLFASTGNAGDMVKQAKILAQATAQLIQAIKGEAEKEPDSDIQRRLLSAAKALADATARMVEAAKLCASNPNSAEQQMVLRQAAEHLRNATNAAASDAIRKKLMKRLENAAKQAASSATQCIAASQGASRHNTNPTTQDILMTDCKDVVDVIPKLVQGIRESIAHPDYSSSHLNLINASQQFLTPGNKLVQSTKSALPTIGDQAASLQLSNSSKQFSLALNDLRSATSKAQEAYGSSEMDSALELINNLDQELLAFRKACDNMSLKPLPGETCESASLHLGTTSKTVGASMAQLLTAASQGVENYTGVAARDTARALQDLTSAIRGVAATTPETELKKKVIDSAREVLDRSRDLLGEAKSAVADPENPENQQRLTQVAKAVSQALNKCANCLPGQKDVDDSIRTITEISQILSSGSFPTSNRNYGDLQSSLHDVASRLNGASSEVTRVAKNPYELAQASKQFASSFRDVLDVGGQMVGQTTDHETQSQMISSMKNISVVSSKLLIAAKGVAADPNAPNAKNQLSAAARAVTDAINQLINVCTSSAPGQKECDNAIRNIQALRPLLENPTEPLTDQSYFDCLETVMEKSKSLGDGMTGIANHAKQSEHEAFGHAVRGVSDSICGLIESAAHSAYLVGVSDPSSIAGRPGLVDQAQFARASQAIQIACQSLNSPNTNQQQVLSAATVIAKYTSSLCNSCRLASSKTANPASKRQFVQSAKDVANATAALVKEIKELDKNYSDSNRSKCAEATKPLIESVDNLCAFANSPEFASTPAKISPAARSTQEPIRKAGLSIIDGSCSMIGAAKSLAVNPKDPPTWQALASHSKQVSDSIKSLVASIRDKAPGQKECDVTINQLNDYIRMLDAASMEAVSQTLYPRKEKSQKDYNRQMQEATSELLQRIDYVKDAAKGEAEKLGHSINQLNNLMDPLVVNSIGSASHMLRCQQQVALLDQTKTTVECAQQLVYSAKECGGNSKNAAVQDLEDSADAMKDSLQDLLATLESAATEAGVVSGLIDSINRAMEACSQADLIPGNSDNFVDCQTRMVQTAKEIARTSQDMVSKSSTNVGELATLAARLSHHFVKLASDSHGAVGAASSAEIAARIRSSVVDLGLACIELVKSGGSCREGSTLDAFTQRSLVDGSKKVSEKVSHVLAALQAGSRGTQACINAASTVSGIIGDLDTTIMFATAGTLNAEHDDDIFAVHRENILMTAKALVEDTKTLVAGAASSQEQLAVAAQNAVSTIVQLADVVKCGAASLGSNNPEAQVMLINAVKDVASALGDLIHATKSAAGKNVNDPAMMYLKDSAKVMVTNVTSLLKTVKAVEDEHTRGTRALEATIEAIAQEIRAYDMPDSVVKPSSPEELVRSTKPITLATAKAVAAGNSCKQEDVIVAANMGRKAISDMLTTCKGAVHNAESADLKKRTLQSGHDCAVQYRELLKQVMNILNKPNQDMKQNLPVVSRNIATCVTEIVSCAEMLKEQYQSETPFSYPQTYLCSGSSHQSSEHIIPGSYHYVSIGRTESSCQFGSDWVDPDDPTVIAENELLGAASSIDAAARKLASLRPRKQSVKEADENLNFDEMILEAAQSIAAATSALMKAASSAQRELIEQGKLSRQPNYASDDGQWSEGLVSAARMVAAATHSLCESANSLVQGHATEEKLISSAKQVASSTAQLLVACKVKADPDSNTMKRLQAAGNAVKKATDNLVKAAQQAIDNEDERNLLINTRMVGGIAQEINARSDVLRIEKELEDARNKLAAIRKAKYRDRPDDSDTDGEISFNTSAILNNAMASKGLQDDSYSNHVTYSSSEVTNHVNGHHDSNSFQQSPGLVSTSLGSFSSRDAGDSKHSSVRTFSHSSSSPADNSAISPHNHNHHHLNQSSRSRVNLEKISETVSPYVYETTLKTVVNNPSVDSTNINVTDNVQRFETRRLLQQNLQRNQHLEKVITVTHTKKTYHLEQN